MGGGRPGLLRSGPPAQELITERARRIPHAHLRTEIAQALAASGGGRRALRLGLEVEMIPVRVSDGSRVRLGDEEAGAGGLALLALAGRMEGWPDDPLPPGLPRRIVPALGVISFEPGGQIEVSTTAVTSFTRAVTDARAAVRALERAGTELGIRLLHRGVDPTGSGDTPLLIDSERYRRQRAHYDAIGPWGRRMMGETAAVHVNVDLGARPVRRWQVANRAAPYWTALFANSPGWVEGEHHRSVRAACWRRLDSTRSGVVEESGDPVSDYLAFALGADHFLGAEAGTRAVPFRASWRGGADMAAWRDHLTTVFPEVRPRGYLEVRSPDAVSPEWYAVPAIAVAGLLYAPDVLAEAERLLPLPDGERLERAGRLGLSDPEIRETGLALLELAIEGARGLGPTVVAEELLEEVCRFRDRFSARGLDLGSEADASASDSAAPAPSQISTSECTVPSGRISSDE